ncbi:response regulator [Muricoccus vinaceus]|uniref:Response regulator n=1 Tax=Muricoccus vinaceus TaxID=424704 RepID=A0ABV6IW42_9PROT
MARILIADDHPVVLEGLAGLLTGAGHHIVARCTIGTEVPAATEGSHPDLLLLDLNMPGEDGLQLLRRLPANGSRPFRIVLLTSSITDAQAAEAVRLGVNGLVLKDAAPQVLVECVQAVMAGRRWLDPEVAERILGTRGEQNARTSNCQLSPREKDIVDLVQRGMRNRQIGERLNLTEGTVKVYLHNIYQKMGVTSRTDLAARTRE